MDRLEMGDPMTLNALRSYDLLMFYRTSNMRAQARLLKTLVNLWDHDIGLFNLHDESLELTTEDIYFISGFSHRGEPVNMEGIGRGGDPLSVQDYINTYCVPGT